MRRFDQAGDLAIWGGRGEKWRELEPSFSKLLSPTDLDMVIVPRSTLERLSWVVGYYVGNVQSRANVMPNTSASSVVI